MIEQKIRKTEKALRRRPHVLLIAAILLACAGLMFVLDAGITGEAVAPPPEGMECAAGDQGVYSGMMKMPVENFFVGEIIERGSPVRASCTTGFRVLAEPRQINMLLLGNGCVPEADRSKSLTLNDGSAYAFTDNCINENYRIVASSGTIGKFTCEESHLRIVTEPCICQNGVCQQ